MPLTELARRLELPFLEWHDELDSTQDYVRGIAEQGGAEWSIVVADHQRRGRGQHGRVWDDEPARGLAFSILLRPRSAEALAVLPIRIGLAIARTLVRHVAPPSSIMLKWPNDLMIDKPGWSGKVGGVLSEAQLRGSDYTAIVGVGLNVFPFSVDDHQYGEPIAFLRDHVVGDISRTGLFELVVASLRNGLRWTDSALTYGEVMEYERYDWLRGHRITSPIVGTAWGITRTGGLVVQKPKGGWETVLTGRVRRD